MQLSNETILSTIPATQCDERLLLVLVQSSTLGSRLELRQQSWSDGVGWFTQSRVEVEPDQVGALRAALGGSGCGRPRSLPERREVSLRLHAESA